jgi:hypothetical protein
MSGSVPTRVDITYFLVHMKNFTSGSFLVDKVAREENRPLTPV